MRYFTVFLWLALLVCTPCTNANQKTTAPASDAYTTIADLPVTLAEGTTTTLGQLKGNKPLYVKFWASWCTTCLQQMPTLQNHFEQHGADIQFVAINLGVEDTLDDVKAMQARFKLTVPLAMDNDGQLASHLGFSGTPYHLLLNEHWQLVHQGHATDNALEEAMMSLSQTKPPVKAPPFSAAQVDAAKLASNHVAAKSKGGLTPLPQNGIVFYTTVWCDWYMANERPTLAKRCAEQQQALTALKQKTPNANIAVWVAPAWTTPEDVSAYKTKYQIDYPLYVDYQDRLKRRFNIRHYARAIVIENGELVRVIEDLTGLEKAAF